MKKNSVTTHSMIMTADTIRWTLLDRKNQTRRVIRIFNDEIVDLFDDENLNEKGFALFDTRKYHARAVRCKYGKPGDHIIVKETFYAFGKWKKDGLTPTGKQKYRFVDLTKKENLGLTANYLYDVESLKPDILGTQKDKEQGNFAWWKRPAMYMPYRASRIRLEITELRAERLQEISEADAKAEGVEPTGKSKLYVPAYKKLWNKINAPRGFVWGKNNWVWVITYKRI